MQIKKGDKFRLEHNKKLFLIIIFLIILLIILFYFVLKNKNNSINSIKECQFDSDCIASSCCHADSCVSKIKAPDCTGIICTQECSSILDCGAGYCRCINNKCQVMQKKN